MATEPKKYQPGEHVRLGPHGKPGIVGKHFDEGIISIIHYVPVEGYMVDCFRQSVDGTLEIVDMAGGCSAEYGPWAEHARTLQTIVGKPFDTDPPKGGPKGGPKGRSPYFGRGPSMGGPRETYRR
jgi:hypothetical protein